MEQFNLEKIKALIRETIEKMGFACKEIEIEQQNSQENQEEETLILNIKTPDSSFLIGQYGANLQSLQHVIRVLVREKLQERTRFVLDINSYRKEKNDAVVLLAKELAEQSIREKRAIVMRPMSPYERRLVHMEFLGNDQIGTESIGEGEERKVVIKPLNLV
jgi:spoIIIJ-associated protein